MLEFLKAFKQMLIVKPWGWFIEECTKKLLSVLLYL